MAQRLQLEGLTSQDDEEEPTEDIFDMESDYDPRSAEMKNRSQKKEIKTPRSLKTEDTAALVSMDSEVTNIAQVDAKIMEYIVKNHDGSYSCGLCGKNSGKKKDHAKNHVETHMEGLSFPCQSCDKTFRSRNALACHNSSHHRL